MINDFSPNELKLIGAISKHWLMVVSNVQFNEISVYRNLTEECFISKAQGPAVEALRRAMIAINKCNPCRGTPEFEKLIEFSEKENHTTYLLTIFDEERGREDFTAMAKATWALCKTEDGYFMLKNRFGETGFNVPVRLP